jgi:hypothetical protein
LTGSSKTFKIQNYKNYRKCQDLTEPDQKDKDPEPADNWVNAPIVKRMNPNRKPGWEREWDPGEEWAEALAWQQREPIDVEKEEDPE